MTQPAPATTPAPPIRVGVSACLAGQPVRHDGGHERDRYLTEVLGAHFELVPFCPEVAAGLGTPRPTIRLVGDADAPRAVGVRDPSLDVTEALRTASRRGLDACADLDGYVLKRGSPSCGMERVKRYDPRSGMPAGPASGIFAAALRERFPSLPVEEEGRLNDPALRESFVDRVYASHRWRTMLAAGLSRGALMNYHARHKYLLLAHDEAATRELGRLLARADDALDALDARYLAGLMRALAKPATRKRHSNVLSHLAGHLKRRLDAADRSELAELVERYRLGYLPLAAPLALLAHHFRRNPDAYVAAQHYLEPQPRTLMLRCASVVGP